MSWLTAGMPRSTILLAMVGVTGTRQLVPLACGLIALAAAAAALVPALRPVGWDLTALPRVAGATGMGAAARARDPHFHTVATGDYDGQFYWGIAVDPIATGDVHQAFDTASYRYGHPLLGWLGWLLSAGQAGAVPAALLAIGLVALAAAALAAARLGQVLGTRGWEGLAVAMNPGLLYAAVHDLAEPLSAALLFGGLLAHARGRRVAAIMCFALLILSKEQFALVPAAVVAWELLHRRGRVRDAAVLMSCILPAVGWWIYARLQLGAWFTSGDTALGLPLAGWKRAVLDAGVNTYSRDGRQNVSAESALVIFAALLCLLAFAGFMSVRLRNPLQATYLLLAIVAACLAPNATVFLRDALRNTAVLVTLVPFVIASLPPPPTWTARRGEGSSTGPRRSPT
jgi:hypothetical protein